MIMKQCLTPTLNKRYISGQCTYKHTYQQQYIPKHDGNTEVIPKDMHTMHALLTPCACAAKVILVSGLNLTLLDGILEKE